MSEADKLRNKEYRNNNRDKINARRREKRNENIELNRVKENEYRLKTKEETKENKKIYAQRNREKINTYYREYYKNNTEKISLIGKKYRESNSEKTKIKNKTYKENFPEKVKESNKKYLAKLVSTPEGKLKRNIYRSIRAFFKNEGINKNQKTVDIFGCTFEFFKIYIESKFEPWMTWDNYGNWNGYPTEINQAWDLDHIVPLSSAKTEDDILNLNHYTNFQPLCSYVNRYIKRNN